MQSKISSAEAGAGRLEIVACSFPIAHGRAAGCAVAEIFRWRNANLFVPRLILRFSHFEHGRKVRFDNLWVWATAHFFKCAMSPTRLQDGAALVDSHKGDLHPPLTPFRVA